MTLAEFLLARIAEDEYHARDSTGWASLHILRDCEAKRQIVGWHRTGENGACVDDQHYPAPCPTLCFLAMPYADHPDCDERWKP